jgi:hypothetical protein
MGNNPPQTHTHADEAHMAKIVQNTHTRKEKSLGFTYKAVDNIMSCLR